MNFKQPKVQEDLESRRRFVYLVSAVRASFVVFLLLVLSTVINLGLSALPLGVVGLGIACILGITTGSLLTLSRLTVVSVSLATAVGFFLTNYFSNFASFLLGGETV